MNTVNFAGRLGRDAETKHLESGQVVTNWSLAVDERGPGGEKATLWVDCTMWGERGEKLGQHLTKGKQIAVSGRVGVRTYQTTGGETRATITLRVGELTLLGGGEQRDGDEAKPAARSQPASSRQAPAAAKPATTTPPPGDDDDIPF